MLKGLRITPIEQASPQHSAAYDLNSNGAAESACKSVGGLLRTLEFDFIHRFEKNPPIEHPIFAWIVEHAGMILSQREAHVWQHTMSTLQGFEVQPRVRSMQVS